MNDPVRVKFWSFPAPIRTEGGLTLTSIVEGRDASSGIEIKSIESFSSGLIRITFGGGDVLRVHGRAFGYEYKSDEELPEKKAKRTAAAEAKRSDNELKAAPNG